jgi:hypothetical protein
MLRTYHFEAWEATPREALAVLQAAEARTEQHDRVVFWQDWYAAAFPRVIVHNRDAMQAKGISLQKIKEGMGADGANEEGRIRLRVSFQREVVKLNMPFFLGNWEERVLHKLKRWHILGNRHRPTDIFMANFRKLGRLVAPRVAAAMWSLAWNRWCTSRRFQAHSPCTLGCGNGTDSVEHYLNCSVVRDVGRRFW